jgi:hypothetical protein
MASRRAIPGLLFLGMIVFGSGCGSDGGKKVSEPEVILPVITSLNPDSAAVGDTIEVLGSGFGSPATTSHVYFGALTAGTPNWTDTRILAAVPIGAQSGTVRVTVGDLTSNTKPFQVGSVPPPPTITIDRLVPARTVTADTVRVVGTGFGDAQGAGRITFAGAGGTRVDATVLAWGATEIHVLVPTSAADGSVIVSRGGGESNGATFSKAERLISYVDDLLPLFNVKGCADCHGGTNNLYLDSAKAALSGESNHGPVVIPRDGEHSILYTKVTSNPPFGSRMPLGCNGQVCVSAADALMITDWIDQGARDN